MHQTHLAGKEMVTLYYPGGGLDLVRPLAILDAIATDAKSWRIVIQDPAESIEPIIGMIQKVTGVIPHKIYPRSWGVHSVVFSFADRELHVDLSRSDALEALPDDLESYEIYFDRAFEIIRSKDASFFGRAIDRLSSRGIVITDSRFQGQEGQADVLIEVPIEFPAWGFYKSPGLYYKT